MLYNNSNYNEEDKALDNVSKRGSGCCKLPNIV